MCQRNGNKYIHFQLFDLHFDGHKMKLCTKRNEINFDATYIEHIVSLTTKFIRVEFKTRMCLS